MSDTGRPAPVGRIAAIDAVRGFAVLGILLMNIVAFAMPSDAYDDPSVYGGAAGADLIAWAVAFVVADGKMRGLFTMLFGASMAIVADSAAARGENAVRVHYARMGWLLVIGLIHGSLIWYGDILTEYALAGAVLFIAWRWRPQALLYAAAILFIGDIATHLDAWRALVALRDAAMRPGAAPADLALWRSILRPDAADLARQVAGYRGTWSAISAARLNDLHALQGGLPSYLIESIGTAAFGLGLYRLGYFTNWAARWHYWLIAIGFGIAVPLCTWIAIDVAGSRFDPVVAARGSALSLCLRPAIMLAYASLIILAVCRPRPGVLLVRLGAAGRMALSNYLATSIVMTSLFYGVGFGLFGRLSRAELYPIVLLMWIAMLLWSKPWLERYRFGPFEWAWRSLARARVQSMRLPAPQAGADA